MGSYDHHLINQTMKTNDFSVTTYGLYNVEGLGWVMSAIDGMYPGHFNDEEDHTNIYIHKLVSTNNLDDDWMNTLDDGPFIRYRGFDEPNHQSFQDRLDSLLDPKHYVFLN